MRILGLTGSIGTGKSHVSSVLASLGACIIDGDQITRELQLPGGRALPALREAFGDGIFLEDGALNRKALGAIVFSDAKERAKLDALMQPLILSVIRERLHEAERSGCPVAVLDMPLLFEAGLDGMCDSIWCTYLPLETQIGRIMQRDGISREAAMARIASQLSPEEKKRRSQIVIDTCGTLDETAKLIPALYAQELDARC
ncbi:MAG: dephospho-CoA kinase [Clostridia bacterium]|nr:dephospho-CoA kinase [Clostridia bacterium]